MKRHSKNKGFSRSKRSFNLLSPASYPKLASPLNREVNVLYEMFWSDVVYFRHSYGLEAGLLGFLARPLFEFGLKPAFLAALLGTYSLALLELDVLLPSGS